MIIDPRAIPGRRFGTPPAQPRPVEALERSARVTAAGMALERSVAELRREVEALKETVARLDGQMAQVAQALSGAAVSGESGDRIIDLNPPPGDAGWPPVDDDDND